MIASDTMFDSRGGFSGSSYLMKSADDEVLRDSAMTTMATVFWLSIYGVHIGDTWRMRLNHPCAAATQPYVRLL